MGKIVKAIVSAIGVTELAVLGGLGFGGYEAYQHFWVPAHKESSHQEQVDKRYAAGDKKFISEVKKDEIPTASDEQIKQAGEIAGGDGIITAKERDAVCDSEQKKGQVYVQELNKTFNQVRVHHVQGVELSSKHMKGCDEVISH